jgi:hypothetical protein
MGPYSTWTFIAGKSNSKARRMLVIGAAAVLAAGCVESFVPSATTDEATPSTRKQTLVTERIEMTKGTHDECLQVYPASGENETYAPSREPLAPTPFVRLPLGSVKPSAWLRIQLRLMAGGLAGHLEKLDEDVGPNSAWLGGTGESWERGPYYFRGLTALAYVLKDDKLIKRAQKWIDWALESSDADGYFGPQVKKQEFDWWPNMVVLDVFRDHYEVTGDERVLRVMTSYFKYQNAHIRQHPLTSWAHARGGDNLDSIYWLYHRTGDGFLLELAEVIHQQTRNYTQDYLGDYRFGDKDHVVNHAMGFKEPAVYYQYAKDPRYLDAVEQGYAKTMEDMGRIDGMFSGDEALRDRGSTRGVEFCAIVEYMYSHEILLRITGDVRYADRLERIALNALPSINKPDLRAYTYYEQQNQVLCTSGDHGFSTPHGDDLVFGPKSGYSCCEMNQHFGWPRYVGHLWMATRDGGLCALQYGACEVTAKVGGGTEVRIVEETQYPFGKEVWLTVRTPSATRFPLVLRIPQWCGTPTVKVNGSETGVARPGCFLRLHREWKDRDKLEVQLPMKIQVQRWVKSSVFVERGPLVFALGVGEDWKRIGGSDAFPAWEVFPKTPWNYGLVFDETDPAESFTVERAPMADQPWDTKNPPIRIRAKGRRIPEWEIAGNSTPPLPESPVQSNEPVKEITLIPYGAAKLRISLFPTTVE